MKPMPNYSKHNHDQDGNCDSEQNVDFHMFDLITDDNYGLALAEIERLIDIPDETRTSEDDMELERLAVLVVAYEKERFPIV